MKFLSKAAAKLQQASRLNAVLAGVAAVGVGVAGYALATGSAAAGASLYMSPSSGTYYPGQTITVSVKANTNGENVNAVQADFTYPTSKLQYQSIDATGSAFAIDAASTGGSGNVSIARGSISNVNSSAALVAKVKFKVLSNVGSAALSFSGTSALVRSSDSTDILASKSGSTYTIKEKTTSTGDTTTKPKTETTTSKPKPTETTTKPDTTEEKPEEEKEEEKKEETPIATTDDTPSKPDDSSAEVAQTKKDDKLFLGLSGSVLAIGIPLLIAILAVAAIVWRNKRLGAAPTSNHNFNIDYTAAQSVSTVNPPVPTPDTNQAPQPPAPQTPNPADPAVQPAPQPESGDSVNPDNKNPGV